MLNIIQLIVAILLIVTILLQQRGSGLGAAFGGESAVYRTKRGAEKTIFVATIILVVLFLGLALTNVYFASQSSFPDVPTDDPPLEGEPGDIELPPLDSTESDENNEENEETNNNDSNNIFEINPENTQN